MASHGEYGTDDGVQELGGGEADSPARLMPGLDVEWIRRRRVGQVVAVMLAGLLRPSPLREGIDLPALCLPVGREGTLLEAWLRVLKRVPGLTDVRIVVNSKADWMTVNKLAQSLKSAIATEAPLEIRTIAEPTSWRGTTGLVRDVTEDLDSGDVAIVIEAHCLPPDSVRPVIDRLQPSRAGVIGISGLDQPSGVYALRMDAVRITPRNGYMDFKEQFLPKLNEKGMRLTTARLSDRLLRMWDRESYLEAVRVSLDGSRGKDGEARVSSQAAVSPSAALDGFCIIEPGAVVEDGAVVQDSVILGGATVGGGAIVSKTIVGQRASIAPRAVVVRQIIPIGQSVQRGQTPAAMPA